MSRVPCVAALPHFVAINWRLGCIIWGRKPMDKWSIFESFGSWSHMWSLSLFRSDDGIVVRKQCTYEQSTMLSVGRMYTAALIPPIMLFWFNHIQNHILKRLNFSSKVEQLRKAIGPDCPLRLRPALTNAFSFWCSGVVWQSYLRTFLEGFVAGYWILLFHKSASGFR